MDDGRFDSLTRALASGASRRSVLKGLLGLGAAAVTGATLDETSEAARRPTPTPRPVTCPGNQTWNGAKCVCPTGLSQCNPGSGPACCNDQNVDPGGPGFSTCCDNACCQGTCYGEERCCATNNRPGEQPPTHRICETLDGDACCAYSDVCCPVDGCCSTVCTDGACCAPDDFCPGGSESVDLCCAGTTSCCNGSTNFNACVDLGSPNACCIDANCDNPPSGSSPCAVGTCAGHVCHYTDCAAGSICCPDTTGDFACRVGDECCLTNRDCEDTCEACDDFVCVDDPDTFPCGPDDDPDRFCCPATNYTLCCPGAQGECCGIDAAREITRECMPDGACCPLDAPSYCADSGVCCVQLCTETGGKELCCAEGEFGCNGDCCPNADTCCDGECCAGSCIREEAETEVCCPSEGSFVCNGNACCTDDQNCCSSDGCCSGHCDSAGHCCPDENSFLCAGACCPNDNTCCGAGTEFEFCCPPGQCNPASGACCAAGNFPCGESCCPNADTCCDGACCTGPC
ncbi:MAG TPA: twin-arginine translocation signal domain-containing protein, partial [Thermomicrobiales bacterium]|nr:twin-arginine translocation signal domain-containing protein [Thermomicrobiales bacterium]